MRTVTAQLPGPEHSDDRIFVTDHAVVMLDGASAFVPVPVPAAVYADTLGRHITAYLSTEPYRDLRAILATAIQRTAQNLKLTPGHSPSSTVTIVRVHEDQLDGLVLGDSLLALPGEEINDNRLDRLDLAPRRRYRERLASGDGYDATHRALLRQLQEQQAQVRNKAGGYWIAEADPAAAHHALVLERSLMHTPWAALATDGAYETMRHLGLANWASLVGMTRPDLTETLRRCDAWERKVDPDGQKLPRAKRHDDKALAVIIFRG
jgi:hypothetical protein